MTEGQLKILWRIPEPVTCHEFARRTGKSESSVRHMMDRRLLPMATEREIIGAEGSTRRFLILWNEWCEMVYEATQKFSPERYSWQTYWLTKSKKLERLFIDAL